MSVFNLYEDINFLGQEKIFVNTSSDKNVLEISRKDSDVKQMYKELLKNDYLLYLHKDSISRFCKREYAYKLFTKEHNFNKYKSVLYKINEPSGRKINPKTVKKLIVIFAKMPGAKLYDSAKLPHRMLPSFFEDLDRSLLKNVHTMRIMDTNVSHGSHYINTLNYPSYEKELKGAIEKVVKELGVQKENVVFYGVSRGGAGAIYHGTKLDYKTLAVDPIVNIGGELYGNDRQLLKGLRKEDLVPDINTFVKKSNSFSKVAICSENVPLYYNEATRLNEHLIKLINLKDDNIKSHPDVSPNSVPEQLMILNYLLGGEKILKGASHEKVNSSDISNDSRGVNNTRFRNGRFKGVLQNRNRRRD
ncbi:MULTISPECIES: accessory Sec system protein Asp2 [Staphylococcus]|uniref:Accessory Sec system protein Asp2 n=1 Tax=Staphylococcus equorum TaxID=246432 RepID=A0AAW7APN9_9STAP|nr:accessory Sec system protein Asp2 [Staphylococcus equorum]MDK9866990.1 accessory Sec system protein Asp2 [Staphylococcus equorum]